MQEIDEKHRRFFKPLLLVLVFALVFLIGWLRFLTGPEYAFSFLYLLPIITVTWLVGIHWGILTSVVSTFSWLLADLSMIDRFSISFIPLVNESFRLMVFLFVVLMIARQKNILETQKELAMMDPLTGVANRRAFLLLAKPEIDRSRRYQDPFSVMVIDIDNFKQINDHFGHHTGDRLLTMVVETIRHHLRAIDIVARFGGDEFVVLLVKSDEKSAALVARKLQKQLLGIMQKNQWGVTFSIGVATYHSAPDSVDETIKAADELMYHVKHNGKNNIRQAVLKA
ncbi:GGDEF domain-containing protein [uncultured Desulfosarcina sp.]|uniref:GGDEF domain-containing protein n=1 Tax=uncultured Desulfosarcina sp. TaxID=218289 RepID=UPI0029C8C443|nr:GGDEF domain-containing protein [uncultured Desulfosarcina sp.]